LDAVPVAVYMARDPHVLKIIGNRLSYEWLQLPVGTNFSKSAPEGEKPEMFKLFKDGVEIPPAKMPSQMAATGIEINDCELDIVSVDGNIRHVLGNARPLRDEQGNLNGSVSAFIDITERKKAEEALKKAHDSLEVKVKERTSELEEAQRMAHIGNWVWDIATDKAYWSEELYRIFGRNPQELAPSYNEYLNYIHPDDRDYADNAHKEALNGKAFSIDHRIILANGEVRTVHIQTEVIFDDENVTIRLKGTVQDITERKRIEEQLRESEEKYRNIVETANEGIIIIDDEAIITYVNKKMVDMLGYTQEEDIRRPIWDFISEEHKLIVKRKLQKRRQGISESYELKLICKDESPLWTHINAKDLFDKNGKFMGSLSMITDITEHKKLMDQTRQRAEEMTKIMDVAPVAMFIGHDPYSQRITGNRTANLLFETEVGENVSANVTPVRRFFSKGHELIADELPMQQAALKNIDVHNVEFDVLLSSEKRRSLLGSASPLHDANGHVRGSVGAFMDITERREAEEALKNIEIARKKEIHHRIKNNLQVISSLLDLQAEQFSNRECITDSEVMKAFKESQDRVTSMSLIHEELYRGGKTDKLDFSSYIKELADNLFLTYSVGNKDISLNMDLEGKTFFDIDTAIPLGIIINELVTNSFKYAFQGRDKGEIRIRLRKEECNNTSFILTISDNGVGIPEDLDIENLDSLGLQLVTTLVDQLDGELELKGNNGTEFTIKFTVTENNDTV